MDKEKIIECLKKLRESEKRKFEQSLDLIINLRNFDARKDSVNLFLNLPHKVKSARLCGFMNKSSSLIDNITKTELEKYKDKKQIKKLIKKYNFFVSSASLMPLVASVLGRHLGPAGKMPSPQLGILKEESDKEIEDVFKRFEKIVRVKSKEPSLKFCVGKENMEDEKIAENILFCYNSILNNLPRKKDNIKSVKIKFTMSKPVNLEV